MSSSCGKQGHDIVGGSLARPRTRSRSSAPPASTKTRRCLPPAQEHSRRTFYQHCPRTNACCSSPGRSPRRIASPVSLASSRPITCISADEYTSVCRKIMSRVGQEGQVVCIHQDNFYKGLSPFERDRANRGLFNYDHPVLNTRRRTPKVNPNSSRPLRTSTVSSEGLPFPDVFDDELMASTLRDILQEKVVQLPVYDFITSTRMLSMKRSTLGRTAVTPERCLVTACSSCSSPDFPMASSATVLPHRPWCLFCNTWNLPIECLRAAPSLVSVMAMACSAAFRTACHVLNY
ncbi:uridine-cytidine kinase isoform X4 [Rhipicephalus microplus]|uniref:uridine-cytidine kinase isoform X4 n=1 Tax=Rhipicephalus microplus TaxID=6941 RepID=UPI003F6A9C36